MTTPTDTGPIAAARDKASELSHAAIDAASGLSHATVAAATSVYASTTAAATDAYAAARERTTSATRAAASGIEANPMVALLGGLALGAIAGALVPRSQREADLLGPLGEKLGALAREAFAAARQAGLGALDENGLNGDAVREQVNKLIDTATKAATAASGAATQSVRGGQA